MKIIKSKKLIKMWTDHVPVEEQALQQIMNISKMPFIIPLPKTNLGENHVR